MTGRVKSGGEWTVRFPVTDRLGPWKETIRPGRYETAAEAALQCFNRALAYDGLEPVAELPAGTQIVRRSAAAK